MNECENFPNISKIKSPVEMQREMGEKIDRASSTLNSRSIDNQRGMIIDHEQKEKNDSNKIATIAAIEGELPYFCFFDDGKQININSSGFSKPALLGLLLVFLEKFKKELS